MTEKKEKKKRFIMPLNHRVYCFYIIIQKTRDFSMNLLAQQTIAG